MGLLEGVVLKSKEGGAKANQSSKESHILKEGPSPERSAAVLTKSVAVH